MGNLGMRSKTGVLCFTLRTEFPLEFFFYQNLNSAKDTEASSVVFFPLRPLLSILKHLSFSSFSLLQNTKFIINEHDIPETWY